MNSIKSAKWIWVDSQVFPTKKPPYTTFSENYLATDFSVAEFNKTYCFQKKILKAHIEVTADVAYRLYLNGSFLGRGPVCAGGDWGFTRPLPYRYFSVYEADLCTDTLSLFAEVGNLPLTQCESSNGQNGFLLAADLLFEDGTAKTIFTDTDWDSRISPFFSFDRIDKRLASLPYSPSVTVNKTEVLRPSEIENLVEEPIDLGFSPVTVNANETKTLTFLLPHIYSGFYSLSVKAKGEYAVTVTDFEKDLSHGHRVKERFFGKGCDSFKSLRMTSAGGFVLKIENRSDFPLILSECSFLFSHYPVTREGNFVCSDEKLTAIYKMGKHALLTCKQSIELDSPMHEENLGCAGDYYIASAMNYLAFGDTALTRFDLVRIADYLKERDGFMFHTTYSLIYIVMIWEYYLVTGDTALLSRVREGVSAVLKRMSKASDETGLIVSPDSYMFVDWLIVDGYSLHHPPKALGEAVLNAFYYGALTYAAKIFSVIGDKVTEVRSKDCAAKVKNAFSVFYDDERGLYFDGRGDESEAKSEWLPKNTKKKYFSLHTNSLAVLFGLVPEEKEKSLLTRALKDNSLIKPQPYFMHFVLNAVAKAGLFSEYGMELLSQWKYMTEFPKGLVEGWYLHEGYGYDFSHVWSGTPTYQLPMRLSGLEILEPGMKTIRLSPCLYGLKWAKISIPTPKGNITVSLAEGKAPTVSAPDGIEIVYR